MKKVTEQYPECGDKIATGGNKTALHVHSYHWSNLDTMVSTFFEAALEFLFSFYLCDPLDIFTVDTFENILRKVIS